MCYLTLSFIPFRHVTVRSRQTRVMQCTTGFCGWVCVCVCVCVCQKLKGKYGLILGRLESCCKTFNLCRTNVLVNLVRFP